jgi:hypothetical protein
MSDLARQSIRQKFMQEVKGMTKWEEIAHLSAYSGSVVVHEYYYKKKYNDRTVELVKNADCDITATLDQLMIMSRKVNLRKVAKSDRTQSYTLSAEHKRNSYFSFDKVEVSTAVIRQDNPLVLLLYDYKGIKTIINDLSLNTVVIGSPADTDSATFFNELIAHCTDLRIPYTALKISEQAEKIKRQQKQKTAAAKEKKLPNLIGVFDHEGSRFNAIEDISKYDYYVPFEDEDAFTLMNFFTAAKHRSYFQADIHTLMHRNLTTADYPDIAASLDFDKTHIKVCYIRPRFVEKYADKVKNFYQECYNKLEKKFCDNWFGFMSFLIQNSAYDKVTDEKLLMLTDNAKTMCNWLEKYNVTPWLYQYLQFPLLSKVAETMVKYRVNGDRYTEAGSNFSLPYRMVNNQKLQICSTPEFTAVLHDYNTLTDWMFPVDVFIGFYQDWIYHFNEEVAAMCRAYPYLFQERDTLIFKSLTKRNVS